jgi:hypothetical protein
MTLTRLQGFLFMVANEDEFASLIAIPPMTMDSIRMTQMTAFTWHVHHLGHSIIQ